MDNPHIQIHSGHSSIPHRTSNGPPNDDHRVSGPQTKDDDVHVIIETRYVEGLIVRNSIHGIHRQIKFLACFYHSYKHKPRNKSSN